MWWKILIAIACGALLISPVDLSLGHIGIDDILAGLGMATTLISTFKGLKNNMPKKADADVNDVNDN